jgi:hypothetical protein
MKSYARKMYKHKTLTLGLYPIVCMEVNIFNLRFDEKKCFSK